MAVIEVEFILPPSFGITYGWTTATKIGRASSAQETRVGKWANLLSTAKVTYSPTVPEEFKQLVDLFGALEGRLTGFLFEIAIDKDTAAVPGQPVAFGDVLLGQGTGAQTQYQLRKGYIFGSKTTYRKITRPRSATVKCGVNGVETSAFTVDAVTGIVTFDTAPGNGLDVTAGFEFLVPMRIDDDTLEATVVGKSNAKGLFTTAVLPLVEIAE